MNAGAPSAQRRIVIDLDNTIIAYDDLFVAAARERGLVGPLQSESKQAVRAAVRGHAHGERAWQLLQADVYGRLIGRAAPFPGVRDFIERARSGGARVAVVSHKTRVAAARPDGPNLREAALAWLCANAFIGEHLIAAGDVHFEASRADKIARITGFGAHVVIDDLLEVLSDPAFPAGPRRWLFVPDGVGASSFSSSAGVEPFTSWDAMSAALDW